MAWQPDYIDTSVLQAFIGVPGTDMGDLTPMGLAITAASRAVDQRCNRQFGVLSSAVERKYYPYWNSDRRQWAVEIDDLMTTSSLVLEVSDSALTLDTDFFLHPINAAADGLPWTYITFAARPVTNATTTADITAKWGWTAVPDAVEMATAIQAERFFKRKDAPFGVAGSPDVGSEIRLLAKVDPDVAIILSPYRRYYGAV